MRGIFFVLVATIAHTSVGQTRFGGDSSSKDSTETEGSEVVVKSSKDESAKPSTSTRFFTGDESLNAGLIGAAAGVGATLLGQALLPSLLGGNSNNGCGRRRRQAEGDKRFFLPSPGGNKCNNPCGRRRRRQVKEGEEGGDVATRGLFDIFGGGNKNTNCGQFNTNSFNGNRPNSFNGNRPNNGFNTNRPTNNGFSNSQQNNNGFNTNTNNGFNTNRPTNNGFVSTQQNTNGFNSNSGFNPNRPTSNGFSSNQQNINGFNTNQQTNSGLNSNRPSNNVFTPSRPSNNQFTSGSSSGSGFVNNKCQCTALSFMRNGRELAKCQTKDETNRIWCYTTSGSNCRDKKHSARHPDNPWSYQACSFLSSGSNVSQFGRSGPKEQEEVKEDQVKQDSSSVNF